MAAFCIDRNWQSRLLGMGELEESTCGLVVDMQQDPAENIGQRMGCLRQSGFGRTGLWEYQMGWMGLALVTGSGYHCLFSFWRHLSHVGKSFVNACSS